MQFNGEPGRCAMRMHQDTRFALHCKTKATDKAEEETLLVAEEANGTAKVEV